MILPRIQTIFAIQLGRCDPQQCTDFIGLKPHRITVPKAEGFSPSWEILKMRADLHSIDDGLKEVIGIISPYSERIIRFCTEQKQDCLFASNVAANEDFRPVYDLSSETINLMASLRASWIMDLFWSA
jgi:hypothetical protein